MAFWIDELALPFLNFELILNFELKREAGNQTRNELMLNSAATNRRRRREAWILAMALTSLLTASLGGAQAKPLTAIEGKLLSGQGTCPLVKIGSRQEALTANTPYLLHTLQDKRLDGREVRLEGVPQPDGSFEVHWLYTHSQWQGFYRALFLRHVQHRGPRTRQLRLLPAAHRAPGSP